MIGLGSFQIDFLMRYVQIWASETNVIQSVTNGTSSPDHRFLFLEFPVEFKELFVETQFEIETVQFLTSIRDIRVDQKKI